LSSFVEEAVRRRRRSFSTILSPVPCPLRKDCYRCWPAGGRGGGRIWSDPKTLFMICDFYHKLSGLQPCCAQTVWPAIFTHKLSGLQPNSRLTRGWTLRKKLNPTMVEPLAAPLATWLLRLRPNPRRPMFAMGWSRALSKHFI
jgi:hypothetical protein